MSSIAVTAGAREHPKLLTLHSSSTAATIAATLKGAISPLKQGSKLSSGIKLKESDPHTADVSLDGLAGKNIVLGESDSHSRRRREDVRVGQLVERDTFSPSHYTRVTHLCSHFPSSSRRSWCIHAPLLVAGTRLPGARRQVPREGRTEHLHCRRQRPVHRQGMEGEAQRGQGCAKRPLPR